AYSRTEAGAVYAIKGCPMHEEPLHLIPPELRPEAQRELGIPIEGSLCPACRVMLREEYNGIVEDVLVHRIALSEEIREGVGTFQRPGSTSTDLSERAGSIDSAAVAGYGSGSGPRAYRFDGELNIANRGILEMQRIPKMDEKFLWHLHSLSQGGNAKA